MPRKTEPRYITEQRIFPTRLRQLMEERGINQKELAAVIDMRPQTVSLYTAGQSVPDINCLYKIAEFFGVSADWLLGRPGSTKTVDRSVAEAKVTTGLAEAAILKLSEANKDLLKSVSSLPELSSMLLLDEFWSMLYSFSLFRHECHVVKSRPIMYAGAKERGDLDAMERCKEDWNFADKDKKLLILEAQQSLFRLLDIIEKEVNGDGKH